jgi:hypothetical protein
MKKLLFIVSVAITLSCSNQTELSDSIYIPDSENPELPAYTEWGYNTFGAFFDRSVFKYSASEIPLKVTVENKELAFIFQGIEGNYSGNYMALRFILSSSDVKAYQDLLVFNDTIIDLTGNNVKVEIILNENVENLDISEGKLNFKRSQKVFVDDLEKEIILSGYFNLKYIKNKIPSTMSDGRFDFGVNNENFYNMN